MDNTCESCKWRDDFTGACFNGISPYCADYTDNDDGCNAYDPLEREGDEDG